MRPNPAEGLCECLLGLWECPHRAANSSAQGWLILGPDYAIFMRDFASGWGPTRAYLLWPGFWSTADLLEKWWKEEASPRGPEAQSMAELLSGCTSPNPATTISEVHHS